MPTRQLKQKGQKATIEVKPHSKVQAILEWTAPVDLDLHAYYAPKKAELKKDSISRFLRALAGFFRLIGLLKRDWLPGEGSVYYLRRGSRTRFPFIYLDKDAGVGGRGGKNEENIYITDLSIIDHILVVANIFDKPNANFLSYDGRVTVRSGDLEIVVPLTASEPGSYCIVAHIDNSGPSGPVIRNINQVQHNMPTIPEFLQSRKE